ncbi:RsbRD N-terminal domain-containing protein [Desulfovibrio sp. OttesenSCG-928-A18]|nr:RsbRD N-terminal domain-containing protein [Desulfovibrio sp. OttesenSCG-928-A18]
MSEEKKTSSQARASTALYSLLWPHREAMSARWIEVVHGTYPFDTIGFLRTKKDQFANPVGYRTEEAAKALMDVVFSERPDQEALATAVEEIVRVRAIQDFSPEIAVGVFFALKDIVRKVLQETGEGQEEYLPALLALESRVDALVLMAFGVYARCREKLHQLRVDEFKRQYSQILRLAEKKAEKTDKADSNN